MTKKEIISMLFLMHSMTNYAKDGIIFTEISTYVKNHCPNIEPEYIEVFRDLLTPLCKENQKHIKNV